MLIPEMHVENNDGKQLTRNQLECAGLVVYTVVLAMVYTIATVFMLLGSGHPHS